MTDRNLVERLNFQKRDVFLDGNKIFTVPLKDTLGKINLLGVIQSGRRIFVGSGTCCYGPISILEDNAIINGSLEDEAQNSNTPDFQLETMRIPDFNVFDIIPAIVDCEKTKFANDYALLTTGYGCAGSGVRLVATYYPTAIEVVSGDEFQKMWNKNIQDGVRPHLRVDKDKRTITLDLLKSGYRLKPGRSRNPGLPTCLIDDSYESYVSQDIWASKDLTLVLSEIGVDVEKTIEANEGYTRIRH